MLFPHTPSPIDKLVAGDYARYYPGAIITACWRPSYPKWGDWGIP